MADPIPENLVPLSAGSRLLGMNREKVLRRLQDGRFRGDYIGGRWYIDRDEVVRRDGPEDGSEG
jgi:hypothetical protein